MTTLGDVFLLLFAGEFGGVGGVCRGEAALAEGAVVWSGGI